MVKCPELVFTRFVYGDVDRRRPRRLPHWHVRDGIQFVTWRLRDSLPKCIEERIERESGQKHGSHADPGLMDAIEQHLDRGLGRCYMNDPHVADIVQRSILFFDGDRYRIIAWSDMPNHAHVIVRTLGDWTLWDIVQSWKKHSGRMANRALGRTGSFWQKGYFDRLMRNSTELQDRVAYVLDNPGIAGLRDWRWSGFSAEAYQELLGSAPMRVDLQIDRSRTE